jgi:protease-4
MNLFVRILVLTVFLTSLAAAQTFPSYYSTTDLSLTSPGALRFGLYGYDNPALLTYVHQTDFQFVWTNADGSVGDPYRWGLFMAAPDFGFGVVRTKAGPVAVTDYRLSFGFGDRSAGFGFAYGFSGGDKSASDRSNVFTLGSIVRPAPYVSVGLVGSVTTSGRGQEAVIDLGLRPFGNEKLTVFADGGLQNDQVLKNGNWSVGAALELLPGIRLTGRYFDSQAFNLGVSLNLGRVGFSGQSTYDKEGKNRFNTYAVRLGAFDRTILTGAMKHSKYVGMDFNGGMKYQRFMLFDNSNTLKGTLEAIAAAKADGTVSGIALNTSGMHVNREMLWEIREQLNDFKSAGKKVIVFIDRVSIEEYHFASIADRIVMDPCGMILMPGYLMGQTYFKGTLEKIGVGFDELRFFKYKSADEYLARDSMSAADREQRQRYIDDLYACSKTDICQGRGLTPERFDQIVNDEPMILPREAMEKKLVDTLGRWEDVETMIDHLEGSKKPIVGVGSLEKFNLPPDARWGERPRIAVIYALGACAMDEGIKARSLVKDVDAAGSDPKIKAIVLRVDSPGGDAMASDYIAEAMKKARKNKPVIVSQGFVAGSGGYWLSMYADTIVSAPSTITGSIGVIGGWMYNKDLKEKLGMSTDHVQVGTHADLGFGMSLPFLGLSLPDRDLTAAERGAAERAIRSLYGEFVAKVAEGRKSTSEKIEQVAQGRFYSGTEARSLRLVDVLGGLEDAIRIAKVRANIDPQEDVTIVEMPKPGLFDFSRLMPRMFGIEQQLSADPFVEQFMLRVRHNGEPMPVMPLDDMILEAPLE